MIHFSDNYVREWCFVAILLVLLIRYGKLLHHCSMSPLGILMTSLQVNLFQSGTASDCLWRITEYREPTRFTLIKSPFVSSRCLGYSCRQTVFHVKSPSLGNKSPYAAKRISSIGYFKQLRQAIACELP